MTRDEALERMAKDRCCAVFDVFKTTCTSAGCSEEQCVELRRLMGQSTATPPLGTARGDGTLTVGLVNVQFDAPAPSSNPKTLMGALKVPNLSVTPFTALIRMGQALQYGAYHAPRADGTKGYGPFNWRDQDIEYMTYTEAAIRHIASAADREDVDPDTGDLQVWHLAEAMATLAILIDAIEHKKVIDNRPKNACGRVAALLRELRKKN